MRYALHDDTYEMETRQGLTLAGCGQVMLNRACRHWVVKHDPARGYKLDEEGKPLRAYALAVVPFGGTLVTVARCYARTRPGALRTLLERAAGMDWRGTKAEGLRAVETTAPERKLAGVKLRA